MCHLASCSDDLPGLAHDEDAKEAMMQIFHTMKVVLDDMALDLDLGSRRI
jgi:hypothetical protein